MNDAIAVVKIRNMRNNLAHEYEDDPQGLSIVTFFKCIYFTNIAHDFHACRPREGGDPSTK